MTEPIKEQQFGEFTLSELFDVSGTKSTDAGSLQFVKKGVNFIGRTGLNNGIQGAVSENLIGFEPNEKDTITISQVGTMVAKYQSEPYYTSQNIAKLKLKNEELNIRRGMYFISLIDKILNQYGGYSTPKLSDIENFTLTLPITEDNEPDYEYMENYIKEIELKHVEKLKNNLSNKISNLVTLTGKKQEDISEQTIEELKTKMRENYEKQQFGEFTMNEMFDIKPTKNYSEYSDDSIINPKGNVPFITTTVENNGMKGYSKLKPNNTGNVLTMSDTTVSEASFYQKDDFIGRSHVQNLTSKYEGFNREIGLYILTEFRKKTEGLYSYAHKMNRERIGSTVITLPITQDKEPDYEYMENYIKEIETLYVHNVRVHQEERIRLTEYVIN